MPLSHCLALTYPLTLSLTHFPTLSISLILTLSPSYHFLTHLSSLSVWRVPQSRYWLLGRLPLEHEHSSHSHACAVMLRNKTRQSLVVSAKAVFSFLLGVVLLANHGDASFHRDSRLKGRSVRSESASISDKNESAIQTRHTAIRETLLPPQ